MFESSTLRVRWSSVWPWVLGALGVVLAWAIRMQVFEGLAHVQDEQAYLWQARVFARSQLTAPVPPNLEAFLILFLKVFPAGVASIFPPGWPAVLSLFERLGLTHLANPLLLGASLLLFVSLVRRLVAPVARCTPDEAWGACHPTPPAPGERLSGWRGHPSGPEARHLPWVSAVLLLLCSQAVFMAGTGMAHTLCLLLTLLIGLSGLELLKTGSARMAALLGAASGLLAATRPVDALAVAGPVLLLLGWKALRGSLPLARAALCLGLTLPCLLGLLLYNAQLTGSPWLFPQDVYFAAPPDGHHDLASAAPTGQMPSLRFTPECNALGFGDARGCAPTAGSFGHTPEKALETLRLTARTLDRQLPGSSGAWLLILPGLWRWRRRLAPLFVPLLVPVLLTPALYALYWYHGLAYGARFWTPILPMVLLGMAGTLTWAAHALATALEHTTEGAGNVRRIPWALGLLLIAGLAKQSGFLAAQVQEYAQGYWCVDGRLAQLKQTLSSGPPALLLAAHTGSLRQDLACSSTPGAPLHCGQLLRSGGGVALNSPFLDDLVLVGYLPEQQDDVQKLRHLFPNRIVFLYIYDGTHGKEELLELTDQGLVTRQTASVPVEAEHTP